MAKKNELRLTEGNQKRAVRVLSRKDLKLIAVGKLKRTEPLSSKVNPKSVLSFNVTVLGNSYPFTFTREQLNEAYESAINSVVSEKIQKSSIEIVK
jgi:hypothetical protein